MSDSMYQNRFQNEILDKIVNNVFKHSELSYGDSIKQEIDHLNKTNKLKNNK